MENKYYTPEISELHVGFGYEHQQDGYDGEEVYRSNMYVPFDIGPQDLKYVKEWVDDGRVRVKYLDKEDIESFGFRDLGNDRYSIKANPVYASWELKKYNDTI